MAMWRLVGDSVTHRLKKAFQQRRCLVIANGFFEWSLEGTIKQPYFFQLTTKEPMAFAGVWEKWTNNEMSVDSFTIITGEPNPFISAYHDRMPIILRPENYSEWLSQDTELNAATELLVPYEAEIMMRFPVNPKMNSPRFNSPDCVTPIQFKDSY
jgi:putative SOS response-associated peptidase YedK